MNSLPDQILDNSAFFRQIYNEARDPILLVDAETWQLIDGNQAYQELLGISEKTKLQTLALLDITPAEQPNGRNSAALLADIETQAKTADYLRFECVHQRLDGGTFEVEVTITFITLNDRKIAHAHWRNIEEEKQIQQQLISNADSFRRVFEDASSPIILISLHAQILEVNQAAVAIFRYPDKDSMVGKTPLEMALPIQPDGQNSIEMGHAAIQLVLQQGTQHFDWQMQCSDGTVISAEVTLTLINNYNLDNKQIIHAHIRDLTEQKRLEADLLAEKERAEITLASIGDAVITTDSAGNITFINNVASQLTGWPLEKAFGQPVTEVFHIVNETTRDKVPSPVDEVLSHGKKVNLANHTVLIAKDGAEYPIEDSAAPITLPDGSLLGCVLVFHDVSEKHELMKNMRWQAGHDTLTSLPNRALLADRFARAIAMAQRQKKLLAVCMVDIDEFKPINDQYGHATGDKLLIEIANRLNQSVRGEDTVARLGGDEFVLLLSDFTETPQIEVAITRIMTTLSAPYLIEGKPLTLSGSIGVALYPLDDVDADTLQRHADQAMYMAKQAGRNRVHWFDAEHDRETQTSHRTLARIHEALLKNELCLYYQPKVNMRNGKIVGMEALLRWQHPEQGLVPPMEFLPLAEQHDLIIDIGEWVIEQALKQNIIWSAAGKNWPISVNIAARHLQLPDFLDRLKILLARYPESSPQHLEIEILESIALSDIQHVQQLIQSCQTLGIQFSLDDFGTGYSSLSYLKRLPANTLKIDQTFVRDMLGDNDDLAVIEAVINLASTFNRHVIAEGVETAEHGVMLMRLGCDIGQGYGIARPMPAAHVLDWAAQFKPDPKWRQWAGEQKWDARDFPLLVAEQDHLAWIKQILDVVAHKTTLTLPREQLTDHHLCRFGQWYYSHGKARYGHLAEFTSLEAIHAEVHQTGTQIIQLLSTNQQAEAQALCRTLLILKTSIVNGLSALQRAALPERETDLPISHDPTTVV